MKTAVIDVGGGLRGIYGAGVFDLCMDRGISFDCCIGVSAGSANIASFLSRQRGRNFAFYYEYSFKKEYMSLGNYISKGSYFDLDYVYTTLSGSDGQKPIDYEAFSENPAEFIIVASEAVSGKGKYFTKADISRDNFDVLKASSAIPVVCRPYEINGVKYFDGGLFDPVPIKKAESEGCDKIVLILTRPIDHDRSPSKDIKLAQVLHKHYPIAAHNLRLRAKRYNDAVHYALELQKEGKALVIAPDDISGVDTMKKSREALLRLYGKGYGDGCKIISFMEQ